MIRKVSLNAAGFAILCAMFALVILACPKPVSYESAFVPGNKGTVEIDYENIADKLPELQWSEAGTESWTSLNKKDTVPISIGASTPNEITLKVVNSDIYESIIWDCDNNDFETGEELVVTAGLAPFGMAKTYHLAVEGTIAGTPYSTYVFIKVGN